MSRDDLNDDTDALRIIARPVCSASSAAARPRETMDRSEYDELVLRSGRCFRGEVLWRIPSTHVRFARGDLVYYNRSQ